MNPNKTKDFDLRQADSVIYQRSRAGTTLDNAPEMSRTLIFLLTMLANLWAQDRTVDPTWLHRYLPEVNEAHVDLSTATCHYKPVFGSDEKGHQIFRSVSRFGEVTIDPSGTCQSVLYDHEEEIYFVFEGAGTLEFDGQTHSLRANDFTYLAPGVKHGIANHSSRPVRALVMGFTIPARVPVSAPDRPRIVNLDEVKEEPVQGHPTSVLYKLLVGPRDGKRDAIDAAYIVTSFFWMDFAPGGTNFPHHHETAEEIYLLVDGEGRMVAGSGMDGIEARFPAQAGDAYYFRPNCTVGFYNQDKAGAKAHILAVRSRIPLSNEAD